MKLEIKNISKSFDDKEVLKDISYTFTSPNLYCILSPSGGGKSTLLSILGLLDSPDSGEVLFDDKKVNEEEESSFIGEHISFTFQDYNLFENLSVFENLSLYEADKEKIKEILYQFKLDISLDSKVKYLSGGERQRLSIIRSLLKGGDIFLFDEPSGNLDETNAYLVFDLIKEVSKTKLCIVVTHNTSLAYQYGDHILKLEDHKLIDSGVGSSSLTLDIKNKGLAAFDELIEIVKRRKSGIILHYKNEEIKVVYDNVFEIIDRIYSENEASIISISYSFINEENIHVEPSYSQTLGRFLTAYSRHNFNNKIGRSVISFILILLISALTLFNGNFTFYNYGKEMEKALQSENIPYTSLYYGDTYYRSGYSDGYLLHHYTSNDDNYYPTYLSQIRTPSHICNFYIVLVKDDTFDFLGTKYKVPTDGSVMVTDTLEFICEALGVSASPYAINISSMSTTEYDFYLPLTFSDNYISTPLGNDFKTGVSFNDLSEYSYGFISYDAFVSQFKKEIMESECPPIYFKTNNVLYEYNSNSYSSSFVKASDEIPQIGRSISNDNDIIISKSLLPNYSYTELSNLINHEISIKDIASLSYDESHLEKFDFNMYDYTQTLTIVGITDDDRDSIIVSEKLYDDILGSIPYTMYSDICSTKCARRLNKLYKQEIQVDEYPVFLITDFYEESVKTASTLYLIIGATLLVLFIIMVFLTASSLIKDKYREIAIMKSLGLKNASILVSFFLTLVVPLLIGTGIGIVLGSVINVILNVAFVNPSSYLYVEYEFSTYMLRFSVWSFVVPIVLCVVIALIAAFFFVRRITNKKAFGALKEFRE